MPLARMEYGVVGQSYVLLRREAGALAAGKLATTLQFTVKEIDPASGARALCYTPWHTAVLHPAIIAPHSSDDSSSRCSPTADLPIMMLPWSLTPGPPHIPSACRGHMPASTYMLSGQSWAYMATKAACAWQALYHSVQVLHGRSGRVRERVGACL